MTAPHPSLVVVAGPNGAGKSTVAPKLLRDVYSVREFVNADVIARGLSGFDPDGSAIAAGRILLERLEQLARTRADFAFETTLASRSFVPWIARLCGEGYRFHIAFLWLSSADLACERVLRRQQARGHGVPEEVVRRRYARGLRNFFELYSPLATSWRFYDNSVAAGPRLIAMGHCGERESVLEAGLWNKIRSFDRGSSMVEEGRPADDEEVEAFVRRELEIERMLRRAVREALLVHKKLGQSIAVSEGTRVVILEAADIPVDEGEDNVIRDDSERA